MEWQSTILFLASILIGFINTLAGSGNLLTLPLLLWVGLPAPVANGTSRLAVVFQSTVGLTTFLRKSKTELINIHWILIPSLAGALLGAYLATQAGDNFLREFISILMIIMLGLLLVNPEQWVKESISKQTHEKKWLYIFIAFLIGFYGGFIQAGVGVFLLIHLVMAVGYNFRYANAVKLIVIALYGFPVFIIFLWKGQADWWWGGVLAIGQGLGAYIAATFASKHPKAGLWTYRLLIIILLGSIIEFYKLYKVFI